MFVARCAAEEARDSIRDDADERIEEEEEEEDACRCDCAPEKCAPAIVSVSIVFVVAAAFFIRWVYVLAS